MTGIPVKSEVPLTRDTVLLINQKRIQGPLNRQNIASMNCHHSNERQEIQPLPENSNPPRHTASARHNEPEISPKPKITMPPLRNPVQKGQKVPMEANGKLQEIRVCVGWNINNPNCDVDVSAFLLRNGKVLGDSWFVFYGQNISPDGSTRFSSSVAPDREFISVDFKRLNHAVDRIAFILTINNAFEQKLNFSMIKDAYIRLIDSASDQELVSFKIEEYYANVTSMTIGEIYLHNGVWKFNAVGNGVGKDLAGLCQMFGVQVE